MFADFDFEDFIDTVHGDMNELSVTFPPLESPPVHFVTENNTMVTSQTGSTALVPCIIHNIGDGTVRAKIHVSRYDPVLFTISCCMRLKSHVSIM